MLIGIYGDVHLTKNMRSLQDRWEYTATKSINDMYHKFDELNVESVVCLGDFFDAPKLEAKNMRLVLPVLNYINSRKYPTYILLGNHEADSEDSNILEYLHMYDNIIPITETSEIEDMFFIPYHVNIANLEIPNKIVFTHHDIYGSDLASGKTKAFFGVDPKLLERSIVTMNGHVHLKSQVTKNVINAGSLLVSSQGELRVGEYPYYYTCDTKTGKLEAFENKHSMIYLTLPVESLSSLSYEQENMVLKVEYTGELPVLSEGFQPAHVSYRKLIEDIGEHAESDIKVNNFDMKNYLIDHINKDESISDTLKSDYIDTGLEMMK